MPFNQLAFIRCRHTPITITVPRVDAGELAMEAWQFERMWDGAYIFWSIDFIIKQILPHLSKTTSDWRFRWWHWWQTHFQRLGGPSSHLRVSIKAAPEFDAAGICLSRFPKPTVSTAAFVLILLRLGSPCVNEKNDDHRMAWFRLLRDIIRSCVSFPITWTVYRFPKPTPMWADVCGRSPVKLTILRGQIDHEPLLHAYPAYKDLCTKAMLRFDAPIPLENYCTAVMQFGRRGDWIVMQLVRLLQKHIDAHIMGAQNSPPPAAEAAPVSALLVRGRRSLKHNFTARVLKSHTLTVERQMLLHWLTARAMLKNERYWTQAFDASRIGGINRLIAVICVAGQILWCPPLATDYVSLFFGLEREPFFNHSDFLEVF